MPDRIRIRRQQDATILRVERPNKRTRLRVRTTSTGADPGGGAVDSVNSQTGVVVLDAADVGAVPITRMIAGLALSVDLTAAETRTALGLGTAALVDVIDEDDMGSNSATRPPSQQSVRAYVDASAGTGGTLRVEGSILDQAGALDLGAAAAPINTPAALVFGRPSDNGVYSASTSTGWQLLDDQPRFVVSDAIIDWSDPGPPMFESPVLLSDPEGSSDWEAMALLPAIGGNADRVFDSLGRWVSVETAGAAAAAQAYAIQRANHTGSQAQSTVTNLTTDLAAKAPLTRTVGSGLSTSGTVNLDMAAVHGTIQTITASGNITFTSSNRTAGREVTLVIAAGGSTRTLAWPAWIAVGAALPTSLASGKTLAVSVTFLDPTDAAAVATAAAQP